ncbi:MAG: lipopolysaccharide biosynthesis protein [Calothrix sp. C42_A2020_038]|nr:lipopolysaccharide biosynthesis protein [Calothrix sp. C42_A2020_038]
MSVIQSLVGQIQKKLSNQFLRNLSWLGLAEIIYRVFRLALVAIMARFLSDYDYGLGAIVLMVREFAVNFSNLGLGAKIIQAEEKELKELCDSAYWLNWLVFGSLFVIQCLIAFPISWVRNTPEVVLPICVSGIAYLVWPISGIQKILIQRANHFKIIAITDSIQFSLASVLSALFAVLDMGVWAFALPAVLIAPMETIIYSKYNNWRIKTGFTTKHWHSIWTFGRNILAIGLFKTLRNNLDYLIVFNFLGVEELGIYFFGFNAGLGISLSIINAVSSAILPHLCAARSEIDKFKKTYFHSLKIIALIIFPFVLLQSSLAPLYVPIVFGQNRVNAIPIIILVCLSAIPRPFADAASQLLVAIGKPNIDLRWNVIFTSIFGITLLIGAKFSIIGVAIAVLWAHITCLPLFTLWVTRYVFGKL